MRKYRTSPSGEIGGNIMNDNNLIELMSSRYSVRKYKDLPVEQEKLDLILEAARVAPTARNYQPQKIYVLQSEEALKAINGVCKCIFGARTVFVIGYDKERASASRLRENYDFGEVDATIVATHMMLEAWNLGLGTCCVGMFNDDEVREALRIPSNIGITLIMPAGYPADDSEPINMHYESRELSDMVEYK